MPIIDFRIILLVTKTINKRYNFVFTLAILLSNCLLAQEGNYLISKHNPGLDQNNEYYDAAISDDGVVYIACRNGVIRYDGAQSGIISSGGSVFDIEIDQSGIIYLGSARGLASIDPSSRHGFLSLTTDSVTINNIHINNNKVYGIAKKAIYLYKIEDDTTIIFRDEFAGSFNQIIEFERRLFVNSENKGILEITENGLSSDIPTHFAKMEILYSSAHTDNNKYAFIDSNGDIFTYENGSFSKIPYDKEKYGVRDFVNAAWIDDVTIALGTLNEGVIILNSTNGKVLNQIDYQSGLVDNEIRNLLLDKNGGLLILNRHSVALVSLNVPIKSYKNYPGLEGELLVASHFNDELFVGTNLGLYKLNKIEDYKEVVSYQRKVIRLKPKVTDQEKEKKGLFGRKKKENDQKSTDPQVKISVQKQVEKELLTSYYAFKPVDSLINHVNQILQLNDQIIISGLSGLFTYQSNQLEKISDQPIRYCYLSNDKQIIFACTMDRILVYYNRNGKWEFKDIFTDLSVQVVHILEHNDRFWISSPSKILQILLDTNGIIDAKEYEIYNPYYSDIYGYDTGNGVAFVSNSGDFKIANNKFILAENQEEPIDLIIDNNNRVWKQNSDGWEMLGSKKVEYPVFRAFSGLKNIFHNDKLKEFWVIAANNNLLKFREDIEAPSSNYVPKLDEIKATDDKLLPVGDFEIQQEESSLSFRISHSDFAKLFHTEYRYSLNGLENQWSDWTPDNLIRFSFLPPGEYNLFLEGRNVYGQKYSIPSIKFSVLPPYWQQPWFYAFEVSIITFLLLISIKLKSWGFRYRLMSRLLAFLTLVIILEYLQAIMEHYFAFDDSPIFSFSLQVVMAIIILPFEGLLKKYIFKEKDVKLTEFLSIKQKVKINTKREE